MKNTLHHVMRLGLSCAVIAATIRIGGTDAALAQTGAILVQSTDLKYQGAFRVPGGATADFPNGYDFGGEMLAFNPARNSLFMGGYNGGVGELSVPTPVASATLADLPLATVIQPMTDPGEGKAAEASVAYGPTSNVSLLVYGDKLIGGVSTYYDASYLQSRSHYLRPVDLSMKGQVRGLYQLGNFGPGSGGRVSGWMTLIPSEWQASLGGPVLAGQCCIPIVTRTSWGPSAFVFNPSSLGALDPVPTVPLLYYPNEHRWGTLEGNDPVWNGSTEIGGMVIPRGTKSLLYFGKHGVGQFCYGTGGSGPTDPALEHCYDPEIGGKGMHGYPYVYQVTAYDLNDLAAVKRGEKNSWDLRPYAVWQINFPTVASVTNIRGVSYDPVTGRIFVTQAFGDGMKPLVHVFTIGGVGTDLTIKPPVFTPLVPAAPGNVRVVK